MTQTRWYPRKADTGTYVANGQIQKWCKPTWFHCSQKKVCQNSLLAIQPLKSKLYGWFVSF